MTAAISSASPRASCARSWSTTPEPEAHGNDAGILVPLEEHQAHTEAPGTDLLLIDAALDRLGADDPELVRLVEMRFFGGMTAEEIAEVRGQSVHAVRHNLRYAQAWLRQQLGLRAP